MTGLRPRTLSEYAKILWHKKLFILLTTGVVLLATWIVIKRLPDLYETRAMVIVSGLRSEEGRQAVATELTLITKQFESRAVLESLIQRHGLYPGLSRDAQIAQLGKSLKLETKLRSYYPELPEAVALSFRYPDPAIAQRVLNDVVTYFAGTNELTARQAAEEARIIESKIAEVEGQLRQQATRRTASRPAFDPRMARAEQLAATATVESLKDKEFALERQIADQQREIAEQQQLVKTTPPEKQSAAQGALLVRKAELEGLLKDYAAQYTEKNPKVTQARNQLAEVNQQLSQLASSGKENSGQENTAEGRELRALQRDLSRLQTELEVTQRELNRRKSSLTSASSIPSLPVTGVAEARGAVSGEAEATYLQNRYVSLLDRQDRIQLALASPSERGLAPFRVVDPPNLPLSPVGPDRTKLQLLAAAVALAIGLGATAMLEGPRLRMIRDEQDAEYFLGAPVVGLIPETLTPNERGHRRRLLLTRKLVLLGLAVVSVPLLVMVLYQLEIIQRIAFR
jgi:uncharacterized protein involved in exopolysaccharide biosynthesis